MPKKNIPLASHEDMKEITKPGFMLSIYSACLTLAITVFLYIKIYLIDNMDMSLAGMWLFISFLVATLTFIGAYLLRQEHHNLAGSIIILVVNVLGLALVSGLFLGPLLGLIGGILSINEHEKLIKHHIVDF